MKSNIILQFLSAILIVFAPNFLLSLPGVRTSEGGGKEVKEILLSSTTCPKTCNDQDGKNCCSL
jgi:hypothetical protein